MPMPNLRISHLARRVFFCVSDDGTQTRPPPNSLKLDPSPTAPTSDCPICFGPSRPTSFSCSNGHQSCDECLVQILRRSPQRDNHKCPICRQVDKLTKEGREFLHCRICDICGEGFTESEEKRNKSTRARLTTKRSLLFSHYTCRQALLSSMKSPDYAIACSAENKLKFGAHAIFHKPWSIWLSYVICER
ncbi:hypothetical protein TrST_g5542 [Triparma strigata]|uniref:RING-type domain-containing protein n=1 Tax=Triparma strigata TaxID=1606541 RepID=A0A9W7BHD0_9STRA|nr:hypothetical protein TrST_g5542 [Triparma strigata]